MLTDVVRAEHHTGSIKVSDLLPYLEAIADLAQLEATARILPMPAGLKPKSLFGKAASANGAVFYSREKLDEMRAEAEQKEQAKQEAERAKAERKQQREERKRAKLAAAAARKGKPTKRKRAVVHDEVSSDSTIPFEDIGITDEEKPHQPAQLDEPPERFVLSDPPADSTTSDCTTDAEQHEDSDDTVTEPDDFDEPRKRRRSSRTPKIRRPSSFLLATMDAIVDSD
jgi:hypothetical protein